MTYTRHGHHIPGTTFEDEHGQVAKHRCGGVAICTDCQKDLAQAHLFEFPNTENRDFFEDTSEYGQDPDRFLKRAKLFVVGAYNNRVDEPEQELSVADLYIVSFTYILGGYKALISTSRPDDGLYFEVTHNAAKLETYVDTYMKIANDKFSQEGKDEENGAT